MQADLCACYFPQQSVGRRFVVCGQSDLSSLLPHFAVWTNSCMFNSRMDGFVSANHPLYQASGLGAGIFSRADMEHVRQNRYGDLTLPDLLAKACTSPKWHLHERVVAVPSQAVAFIQAAPKKRSLGGLFSKSSTGTTAAGRLLLPC